MIHSTSIISKNAKIGNNVKVGPFSVIGDSVTLMDNVEVKSHVVIDGITSIGENTIIYPFASIGNTPQDLKYKGEASMSIIGKNNVIREYVTIQPGTEAGSMVTTIGDNGLFMVGVHIAHDCKIGNNVIISNYSNIGGHVEIGDFAVLGGMCGVLQFVKIGAHSMLGGMSSLSTDLIPFGLANNERAKLTGLNLVGMRRRNFDAEDILEASNVVKELLSDAKQSESFAKTINLLESQYQENEIIKKIIDFLKRSHNRTFCRF